MYSCLVALEDFPAPIPTQSPVPLSSPYRFGGGGEGIICFTLLLLQFDMYCLPHVILIANLN